MVEASITVDPNTLRVGLLPLVEGSAECPRLHRAVRREDDEPVVLADATP